MLGHKRTALYPSLVQLVTAPEYPRALKGVRADCALRLYAGESLLAESSGELQFIETGVSGPAVFDLSRAAATGGKGLTLAADFLRDYDGAALLALLKQRRATLPGLPAGDMLTGIVHNRLGKMLVKYAALNANTPCGSWTTGHSESSSVPARTSAFRCRGPRALTRPRSRRAA